MSMPAVSCSLLRLPPLKSLSLSSSSPGSSSLPLLNAKPSSASPSGSNSLTIRAMRSLQGRVVATVNDKTVAVEVTRLAPHPKYKRRVRKKKKYQAHDPDNFFKVGDFVQLEKCRPISKTKTFLAVPVPDKRAAKPITTPTGTVSADLLGLPLESQQQQLAPPPPADVSA